MKIGSARVQKWRQNNKRRLLEAFGNCCCICGYNKCPRAMQFHHLDPNEKEFAQGVDGQTRSLARQVEELKKCVLLCANCHMEVHDNVSVVPIDAKRIDVEMALGYRTREFPAKPKETKVPKLMGKVDWSKVDVMALVNKEGSYEAAGRSLGITGAAVKRRYLQVVRS